MKKLAYAIALILTATVVVGCKDDEKKNPYAPVSEQPRKTDDARQF